MLLGVCYITRSHPKPMLYHCQQEILFKYKIDSIISHFKDLCSPFAIINQFPVQDNHQVKLHCFQLSDLGVSSWVTHEVLYRYGLSLTSSTITKAEFESKGNRGNAQGTLCAARPSSSCC